MIASLLMLIDSPEDKSRFEKMYNEYERLLFYVARKRLGDNHLAEDAVNEAFIRIIKNFDKIEEIICPRTKKYVVVIVRNVCADIYAKRHRIDEFLPVMRLNTYLTAMKGTCEAANRCSFRSIIWI